MGGRPLAASVCQGSGVVEPLQSTRPWSSLALLDWSLWRDIQTASSCDGNNGARTRLALNNDAPLSHAIQPMDAFFRCQFSADCIINMCGFNFRQGQATRHISAADALASLSGGAAPTRPLQWLDLAEGRLRLDRLCRNAAGRVSSPGLRPFLARQETRPPGVLRVAAARKRVRRRSPSAFRSPSRP